MLNIPPHILERKGARKMVDIPDEVLSYLNKGLIETRNLTEWLAVDQMAILKCILAELGKENWMPSFVEAVAVIKKPSANTITKTIGLEFGQLTSDKKLYRKLRSFNSDMVRGWACWGQSIHHDNTSDLLDAMRIYAADKNAGMREVVIFATKERLAAELEQSIGILSEWAKDEDENIRRYAIETIRPIGVWTKKIAALQSNPSQAVDILELLKSDPSKYVQNATGNWLNDASKSQPKWVTDLVARWTKVSDTKETKYIVKRGMRTINKTK